MCGFLLLSFPPIRGHKEHTFPPVVKMQQHVWGVFAQGSPLDQHPNFFIGTGHIGTLYLTHTKTLVS